MWALYLPVYFYWLYLSLRARSFFFFSAVNPTIPTGGMVSESKFDILQMIPGRYRTFSLFFAAGTPAYEVLCAMRAAGLTFPIILKPDVGERGTLVEKIQSEQELYHYLEQNSLDLLLQPYIDYPVELAILFYRHPADGQVQIFSICEKQFLGITGDGCASIGALIDRQDRAVLRKKSLLKRFGHRLHEVLPTGVRLELEPIGNHCRGTAFLDARHLHDDQLQRVIENIVEELPEVYFGRFDLRCSSVDDLKAGRNIAILEMNGVGAEPAHIYDPKASLLSIYRTLLEQWTILYRLARYNHDHRGIPYMSLRETRSRWRRLMQYRAGLQSYQPLEATAAAPSLS